MYYKPSPYYILNEYKKWIMTQMLNTKAISILKTMKLQDYGPDPSVFDIENMTKLNDNFRTVLWTGDYLQLVLMSINVGGDIGLEQHNGVDQFIRIEEGQGYVMMGNSEDNLDFKQNVKEDDAFIVPAGKWHNLINTGKSPLKLYTIYAPPQHPFGTVQKEKEDEE